MNRTKLGRLTIVILIAVVIVVMPYWVGEIVIYHINVIPWALQPAPKYAHGGLVMWAWGILTFLFLIGPILGIVLLILYPLINYIKHGK